MTPRKYEGREKMREIAGKLLGKKLQEKRQEQGLSRESVAAELKTSATTVYRWESARALPAADDLLNLAEVYDSNPGDFMPSKSDIKKARQLIERSKNGEKR